MAKQKPTEAQIKAQNEMVEQANEVADSLPEADRRFKTVETKRGKVVILESSGEVISGILTGKPGRVIGEEPNEIGTLEIFDTERNQLFLLPLHTTLKSGIDQLKQEAGDQVFVQITYLGKKEGKKNTYHDYQIQYAEPEQSELNLLAEYEQNS